MNEWQTDPNKLAWKMLAYIEKEDRDVTYSELEKRALLHNIDLSLLDVALGLLHKHAKVKQRVKGGDIVYCSAKEKPRPPSPGLEWLKHNYPAMDSSNDGSGIEADYSYLFLSPEDLDKYKAEAAGRTYVPKKRYQKKATPKAPPPPTKAQQIMLQFAQ